MQTDWLIDFMTLAETRSFSRAAQLRHVTQPAFSRRIRSLEAWATTALVDRSHHPLALTPAGQLLRAKAPELVAAMQHTHALLRGHTPALQAVLRFAAPHALAFNFFPDWIHDLEAALDGLTPHLHTLHAAEALKQLNQGDCDLMLAYVEADSPPVFDPRCFEVLRLGRERLLPCARPDARGEPRYRPPATAHPSRVFDVDACESQMAMALAGQGLAFLPERSVQAALARERLVVAGPPLPTVLDICLVRLRPIDGAHTRCTRADGFWRRLLARGIAAPDAPPAHNRTSRNELLESA